MGSGELEFLLLCFSLWLWRAAVPPKDPRARPQLPPGCPLLFFCSFRLQSLEFSSWSVVGDMDGNLFMLLLSLETSNWVPPGIV